MQALLIENSYWVRPGQLLAGEYPTLLAEPLASLRLASLLDAGISFFLDLTEEDELEPYSPLLKRSGADHQRISIVDMGVPSKETMRRILDTLDAALEAGQRVYLHCWGGIGRTGTVIGCHLVRHGMSGAQALEEIVRLRAGTRDARHRAPATDTQRRMVLGWQPGQ